MEALTPEEKDLFLKFQERWSLEKVKEMSLEEYTQKGYKDTFTYWIEHKLGSLGGIKGVAGGLGNLKFGICHCDGTKYKVKNKHRYSEDKQYAWLDIFYNKNDNPNEAFKVIKSKILQVIQYSKNNQLNEIEKIELEHSYKWKIAFHYQNIDNIRIVCIFSKDILQKIAKGENLGLGDNPSTVQIYNRLLNDKTYTLETMCEEKSVPLSQKYKKNTKRKTMENNTKTTDNINSIKEFKIPLNQILYGPPGTGKTYHTINKALEILFEYGEISSIPEVREEKKKIFDDFKEKGQIEFITFHQNFSYEEFVEGIKPVIDDSSQNMTYEVRVGIFKNICERALVNYQKFKGALQDTEIIIKELFQNYAESLQIRLNEGEIINFSTQSLKTEMNIVKVNPSNGEAKSISLSSKNSNSLQSLTSLTREIVIQYYRDFKDGKIKTYKDIKPKYESQSQWHGNAIYYFALMEKLREFEKKDFKPQDNNGKIQLKPYILIIDEINRGNISKILGELITLIEPSKRIGNDEELKVTLPYSNEKFGVPKNLYIIGTMNTADRSIALLDTALRRRFEFIEMMPDYEELRKIFIMKKVVLENRIEGNLAPRKYRYGNIKDIGYGLTSEFLSKVLKAINHRIEFLLDREHMIGHTFFFEKAQCFFNEGGCWYELSLDDLKAVFAKKIIPLLQEYFYDDYAKIDAVLNGNGMIKVQKSEVSSLFPKDKDFDLEDKNIYEITDSKNWNEKNFQKIYDNSIKLDSDDKK